MFFRKVTFHKGNATKDLEANLLPTYTALTRHILRATYVLKLVFSVTSSNCPVLKSHCSYGWVEIGPEKVVEIDWDDECVVETFFASMVTCGCKKGCKTNRCKCRSNGKKCSIRCKCVGCSNNCVSTSIVNCNTSLMADMEHITETDDETYLS